MSCVRALAKPFNLDEIKVMRASGHWPSAPFGVVNGQFTALTLNINSSVANVNLRNRLISDASYDGTSVVYVSVRLANGVTVYSNNPTLPAIDCSTMPSGCIVMIEGISGMSYIRGAGGAGGAGGDTGHPAGYAGQNGGDAIRGYPCKILIDLLYLTVQAGGGGGGGGALHDDGVSPSPSPVPSPGPGPSPSPPTPPPNPGPEPTPTPPSPPWPPTPPVGDHDDGGADSDADDSGDDSGGDDSE